MGTMRGAGPNVAPATGQGKQEACAHSNAALATFKAHSDAHVVFVVYWDAPPEVGEHHRVVIAGNCCQKLRGKPGRAFTCTCCPLQQARECRLGTKRAVLVPSTFLRKRTTGRQAT